MYYITSTKGFWSEQLDEWTLDFEQATGHQKKVGTIPLYAEWRFFPSTSNNEFEFSDDRTLYLSERYLARIAEDSSLNVYTPKGMITTHEREDAEYPGISLDIDGESAVDVFWDSVNNQLKIQVTHEGKPDEIKEFDFHNPMFQRSDEINEKKGRM